MKEQNKIGRAPDYKGDGVAIWVNQNEDGQKYLSVVVLNSIRLAAFKYEQKQKDFASAEVKMSTLANSNEL